MGWLTRFSGGRRAAASVSLQGFFWKIAGTGALACVSDWNQEVMRESFRRDAIKRVAGGTRRGVDVAKTAECVATKSRGRAAVQVVMDGTVVGWIPDGDAAEFHAELLAIAPSGHATAKGHISAGSDGAQYCVRLSLARPLRLRTA
jgi:hypothetical protein